MSDQYAETLREMQERRQWETLAGNKLAELERRIDVLEARPLPSSPAPEPAGKRAVAEVNESIREMLDFEPREPAAAEPLVSEETLRLIESDLEKRFIEMNYGRDTVGALVQEIRRLQREVLRLQPYEQRVAELEYHRLVVVRQLRPQFGEFP